MGEVGLGWWWVGEFVITRWRLVRRAKEAVPTWGEVPRRGDEPVRGVECGVGELVLRRGVEVFGRMATLGRGGEMLGRGEVRDGEMLGREMRVGDVRPGWTICAVGEMRPGVCVRTVGEMRPVGNAREEPGR